MKLITLKTFLCCMTLETGGVVISSLYLILQGLVLIFGVAFLTIYDCEDFEKLILATANRICMFNRDFIAFMLLLVIFSIGLALLPYWCIKAIQNRNYVLVKPFMIFLAVVTLLSMYDVVFFTLKGLLSALVKGTINSYFFVIIHSLYKMLRDEPKRQLTLQIQHPADMKSDLK